MSAESSNLLGPPQVSRSGGELIAMDTLIDLMDAIDLNGNMYIKQFILTFPLSSLFSIPLRNFFYTPEITSLH